MQRRGTYYFTCIPYVLPLQKVSFALTLAQPLFLTLLFLLTYRSISISLIFVSSLIFALPYANIAHIHTRALCVYLNVIFLRRDKQKLISRDNSILMEKKVGMSKSYLRTDSRWNIDERSLASREDFAQRPPNGLRNFPRAVNNSPVVRKQRNYSWNSEDISGENLENAKHKRPTGRPIFLLLNLSLTHVLLAILREGSCREEERSDKSRHLKNVFKDTNDYRQWNARFCSRELCRAFLAWLSYMIFVNR